MNQFLASIYDSSTGYESDEVSIITIALEAIQDETTCIQKSTQDMIDQIYVTVLSKRKVNGK